jgi:hypothetical protein
MRFTRALLPLAALALLLIAAAYAVPLRAQEGAPSVPHPLLGRVDCLSCHGKSVEIGEGHEGRTNDTCTMCHGVRDNSGIPPLPHPTQGQEKCLECHAAGKVRPFPGDHTFQTEAVCLKCHPVTALAIIPVIPHPMQGREDCLSCHGAGQLKPVPADHQGRTDEMCSVCHQLSATANAPVPEIPHPTQGREDCLACHAFGQVKPYPADHQGRAADTCLACHQMSAAAAAATPVPAPDIPHPIAGREDCASCHGLGQVRPFPADHQGRADETCQGCHEVNAAEMAPPSTEVVPTPISEPELFGENSCVTCHQGLGGASAQKTQDWQASVHAAEGVGCVSCHGGDPNQADAAAAMSAEAGFLGVPSKGEIPGLCASCHSNVDLMRPYNIPIDQFDQYWQSQHGQALVEGDQNVATCYDCHGGHKVLGVKDPAATVYPTNEPGMCAGCHADGALMAGYGIPADQYGQYQASVHGVAALQNQDQRAPTCSTCHGVHGAAPPGFSEVATVCGQCHAKTQDYYQQGAHKAGLTGEGGPGCITCHGQHDVTPASRNLFVGSQERHCGACHAPGSAEARQVDAIYEALKGADNAYAEAEAVIAEASSKQLIVTQQEETLQQANTPLIESRALQHTVNVAEIEAKAQESVELSQEAQASAEALLKDLSTRYVGMVVALAVILLTILALVLIKRQLDRDLEAKRARQGSRTP